MANATTPQVVRSYLAQLEKALDGITVEVRDDIVAGVAEELDGLDAAAVAIRIEELGDPEFIAAEARAETGSPVVERVQSRRNEPRWYPVLAVLVVALGGIVIPVVGWIVGLAMVWFSKSWSRTEKWVATLASPLAVLLATLTAVVASSLSRAGLGFDLPSGSEARNPLIPALWDFGWSGVILFTLVNVVVGVWLLWRANRSWSVTTIELETSSAVAVAPRGPQALWYPTVTVLLIIGGGFIVPIVGWVVGITMLWAADAWSIREKLMGTLAGPSAVVGGVLLTGGLILLAQTGVDIGGALDGWLFVVLGGLVLPLIANVVVGIQLLRKQHNP